MEDRNAEIMGFTRGLHGYGRLRRAGSYADRKVIGKGQWVDKVRVFAFSKQIDHLTAQLVYKIGIRRWDIDADLFMDMTKHWHLNIKHSISKTPLRIF